MIFVIAILLLLCLSVLLSAWLQIVVERRDVRRGGKIVDIRSKGR